MAEKIVSPGVFTRENDFSFIPQGIAEIGAAIVGPTVKGPANVPTEVNSFAEYGAIFGTTFVTGSKTFEYMTSMAADLYLKHSGTLTVVRVMTGSYANATSSATASAGTINNSFMLKTIGDGTVMNSTGTEAAGGVLAEGTSNNLRWEVQGKNDITGTFNLLIRAGNDTANRKTVLETYNNISLDPNQNNYIGKAIGTYYPEIKNYSLADPYVEYKGSFARKSKYVYVDEASITDTLDWYDADGGLRVATATGSLPANGSGSFGGGSDGSILTGANFLMNDACTDGKVQGYDPDTAYITPIKLLANPDEYDVNVIAAPGLTAANDPTAASLLLSTCESRGDCIAIVDPVLYGSTITNAVAEAASENNSYGAMYWPWIQLPSPQTGKNVWVPASVAMPGIYAFSDSVAAEWYAPAGLNRGGLDTAIRAERKLTHAMRDTLYEGKVNPLATFPGEGVVVWGQKTLQKKATALDRVNVRRLLINLKKFIASTSKYLVFENNTEATRNRFLATVNPYMETVQQNNGLYAFKVVMDDTNNTPDVIDRNIMKGDIYLQPAKAAEFIIIDFNIMPTGATFGE
jgi:hypothetical protein